MAVPKTWTTNEVLTAADLNASLASTAWTAVTFTNSWVNFGGSDQTVQYRLVGDLVHVRGTMKTGTMSTAAFTLPAGFRPPATLYFTCMSNNLFGLIGVTSGGVATPSVGSNTSFVMNFQFSVTT